MTVKELIEEIEKLDQSALVFVRVDGYEWAPVGNLTELKGIPQVYINPKYDRN